MRSARALPALIVVFSTALLGQPAIGPAFEVASIKPAPPQEPGRVSKRMSSDPGRLTYTNFSLADLIGLAYRVQRQQIVGPVWIDQDRFDILAKFQEGASRSQLPEMWQALLKDRFQLKLHMDRKELPVYALVGAKNGPKLQPADKSAGLSIGGNARMHHLNGRISMSGLAEYLSDRVERPVVDQTGMEGDYLVALEWITDPAEEPSAPVRPAGEAAAGPTLFQALQERLGLKLAAAKAPVQLIVIDSAFRIPTEN